jgi:hypothetical protein
MSHFSMHPDHEQLYRWLDLELVGDEAETVRLHVADCAICSRWLAELSADANSNDVTASLSLLDVPPPVVSARDVLVRADACRRAQTTWLRAAAMLIGFAGVAAAAVSPGVRRAISTATNWVVGAPTAAPSIAPEPASPETAASSKTALDDEGIAVTPTGKYRIAFRYRQREGVVNVMLKDSGTVVVRAPRGSVTFESSPTQLRINNQSALTSYYVRIPRTATQVEILVGGRRVFFKVGERVESVFRANADGNWQLPLTLK